MKVNSFVFCGEAKSLSFALKRKHPQNSKHFRKRGLFKAEGGGGWGVTVTPFFEETLEDPTHLISSESAAATSNTSCCNYVPRQQLHPSPAQGRDAEGIHDSQKATVDGGGSCSAQKHVGPIEVLILQDARDSRRLGHKTMTLRVAHATC